MYELETSNLEIRKEKKKDIQLVLYTGTESTETETSLRNPVL